MSDQAFWTMIAIVTLIGVTHWTFIMAPYWMAERRLRAIGKDKRDA